MGKRKYPIRTHTIKHNKNNNKQTTIKYLINIEKDCDEDEGGDRGFNKNRWWAETKVTRKDKKKRYIFKKGVQDITSNIQITEGNSK